MKAALARSLKANTNHNYLLCLANTSDGLTQQVNGQNSHAMCSSLQPSTPRICRWRMIVWRQLQRVMQLSAVSWKLCAMPCQQPNCGRINRQQQLQIVLVAKFVWHLLRWFPLSIPFARRKSGVYWKSFEQGEWMMKKLFHKSIWKRNAIFCNNKNHIKLQGNMIFRFKNVYRK